MKKILIIIIGLCIGIVILGVIFRGNILNIVENIKIQRYGEPINIENGLINNKYFGIDNTGSEANAIGNRNAINAAIEYANKNNINEITFEEGTYVIDSEKDTKNYHYHEKGIILKDNITIDLNGSTIKHITNDKPCYVVFSIIDCNNVEIKNGMLEGDKDEHIYSEVDKTHEYGMGIDISGGSSIKITNLDIKDMTGDGIFVGMQNTIPEQVEISNCNIYDCRRQGISVLFANNINIINNEIHNIKGTNPQSCIDLESGTLSNGIKNIKICGNKLYASANKDAIFSSKNVYNLEICHNEIQGDIHPYHANEEIRINDNEIKSGNIEINLTNYNLDIEKYFVKKIIIKNNNIIDGNIKIGRLNSGIVRNNKITNGKIQITSMNMALEDNVVINTGETKDCAYQFDYSQEDENKYIIYDFNNKSQGNFKMEKLIIDGERITISEDKNELENFEKEIGE